MLRRILVLWLIATPCAAVQVETADWSGSLLIWADDGLAGTHDAYGAASTVPFDSATGGAVVTGRVLGEDLEPRPNALVWIGERHAVRTDGDGVFVLENLPPGARTIKAQWRPKRRRSPPLFASRSLTLVAGERHERVELLLER